MKDHVTAIFLASAVLAKNEPCGSRSSCEVNCVAGDYTIGRNGNGLPAFVCAVGTFSGKTKNVNVCAASAAFDNVQKVVLDEATLEACKAAGGEKCGTKACSLENTAAAIDKFGQSCREVGDRLFNEGSLQSSLEKRKIDVIELESLDAFCRKQD